MKKHKPNTNDCVNILYKCLSELDVYKKDKKIKKAPQKNRAKFNSKGSTLTDNSLKYIFQFLGNVAWKQSRNQWFFHCKQ
jgi:hypothetical protein